MESNSYNNIIFKYIIMFIEVLYKNKLIVLNVREKIYVVYLNWRKCKKFWSNNKNYKFKFSWVEMVLKGNKDE